MRVKSQCTGSDGVSSYLSHHRVYLVEKIVFSFVLLVEVQLEVLVADLVAFLVLAVVGKVFLDGVIGEMDVGLAVVKSVL